jgi:hypothetical protein
MFGDCQSIREEESEKGETHKDEIKTGYRENLGSLIVKLRVISD